MAANKLNIIKCPESRALEILQDPTVARPWGFFISEITDTSSLFLVNDAVLLSLRVDRGEAEVHIAIRRRDRRKARDSLLGILSMLQEMGVQNVITTAPDERKALCNMLTRLGFINNGQHWVKTWD